VTPATDSTGSALLLLDCQDGVAGRVFGDPGSRARFVSAVRAAVGTAQAAGLPCIRVEVEFRPGHPEVSPANAYFGRVRDAGRLVAGTDQVGPMSELADLLEPLPRVVKRRIGAFPDTDLAVLLRGLSCDGVVLAGLITSGAVLSTACHAADLDYRVTVLSDACHDPTESVHRALLDDVLPMRGDVVPVGDFSRPLRPVART
jgi:nicotinamidase-related amidase